MSKVVVGARRLPHVERRAQLLAAARRVLARHGVDGFSLDDVAREADVALTLPRYYFGSREGLLIAAVAEVADEVIEPLIRPDPTLTLADRFRTYIALVAQESWSHSLWMRPSSGPRGIDDYLQTLKRRLVMGVYARPWQDLSAAEQMRAAGLVGFVGFAVDEWLHQGSADEELLLTTLLGGVRRLVGVQE